MFYEVAPADKQVPLPAQLPISDIEPDEEIYFPPLHVFQMRQFQIAVAVVHLEFPNSNNLKE